jgi:hypothetical protein
MDILKVDMVCNFERIINQPAFVPVDLCVFVPQKLAYFRIRKLTGARNNNNADI